MGGAYRRQVEYSQEQGEEPRVHKQVQTVHRQERLRPTKDKTEVLKLQNDFYDN